MSLGQISVISIGKENIYLSAQPEITYFKIAYKRHTNYSIEPIPQYFKTTPDFGRRCTVNIGKNADLLGMIYLYVELPIISNNSIQFSWVEKIGLALINFVEIEINGYIIDRHYGDWMNIWNELTISKGHKKSYNKMIGNISELTDYSYSKKNMILYIPFSFWFCLDSGLSLPLIALFHCDIKIHVDFNDIDNCYKISPSNYMTIVDNFCIFEKGELFYQIYQNNKIIGEFIYFDPINQRVYYNPIKDKFIIPTESDINLKLIGSKSNYQINIKPNSVIIKNYDYFKFNKPSLINSFLLANYIFLDNFERANFINNSHEYIIQTVQNIPEQTINSINTSYKLSLVNPIKLLIWRAILSSNKNNNNHFNYMSLPYTNTEEYLIKNNQLVINSINRMSLNSYHYYTNLPYYQYNFNNEQKGIYMYSFALNPKELQPSGSLNFSKIDDAYIQLTMNNIVSYQNAIILKGYGIQYNILKISNGIGSLGFDI